MLVGEMDLVDSGQWTVDRECWLLRNLQIDQNLSEFVTSAYRIKVAHKKILINQQISEGNYPSLSTVHCPLLNSPAKPKFESHPIQQIRRLQTGNVLILTYKFLILSWYSYQNNPEQEQREYPYRRSRM